VNAMDAPGTGDARLEPATVADLDALRALLERLHLPTQDVGSPHQTFIVARVRGELVGCVGLERYGDDALLRSLGVVSPLQGAGLGTALFAQALAEARRSGVQALYLLTTTAAAFFEERGFARIARSEVPAPVAASAEFRSLCPQTAACLRLSVR